ncbi:MAG: NADH-quinone oxidoreductase subunit J [Myxococcota bacterium]
MNASLESISFAALAAATLVTALRVVTTTNLVHTVLWLGLMLAATAGLFLMLLAPFLAAIQLILYTGGVLTLMLFGVMLTHRDRGFTTVPNESRDRPRAAILAVTTFAVLAYGIVRTPDLPDAGPVVIDARRIGEAFLTRHVLAFEVLSLLLLAAVLGAIVLARKQDPTGHPEDEGPRIPARPVLARPTRPRPGNGGSA